MLKTKAVFSRKENSFKTSDCIIEKVIELDTDKFLYFKDNLLRDYDFISENIDLQYVDCDGVNHCLLIIGKENSDGILCESEGSNFARYSSYLPNVRDFLNAQTQEQIVENLKSTTLSDLLLCKWEEIHLCHSEIENDPTTIVELSNDTLTAEGKAAWTDVLNARVERVYNGCFGTQLEISGVKASRLDAFSSMLAGYCACEDYEKWVVQDDGGNTMSQEM